MGDGGVIALVCGSRTWTDFDAIRARIAALPDDAIVIEGGAEGADTSARHCAEDRGLFVAHMRVRKSHWHRYGRRAGHERNHAMLDLQPDLVIAFQHNASSGTQGTIDEARRRGMPVEVHTA